MSSSLLVMLLCALVAGCDAGAPPTTTKVEWQLVYKVDGQREGAMLDAYTGQQIRRWSNRTD